MMVKEFEDAAYKLEVGQLSEPVKSSSDIILLS